MPNSKEDSEEHVEFSGHQSPLAELEEDSEEEIRQDALLAASHIPIDKELKLDDLAEILSATIKKDWGNKIITFLVCLGTYTEEEQSNLMYKAESSTGKSYIPLEVLKYFPEEDVIKVSHASPTSFWHEFGTPVYETIQPMVEEEDGKKKKKRRIKHYELDMSKKIYIFKDMPSTKLLENLRSLLSHDEKEMQIQITQKLYKYGYRARHVHIIGFPTVIFCTASRALSQQEATRFFILSPEIESEKLKEAIILAAERRGNKPAFEKQQAGNVLRAWLKQRIRMIKEAGIIDVIVSGDMKKLAREFMESRERLQPRHMRDFPRVLMLIKYWSLFNFWHREPMKTPDGLIIYANDEDRKAGFTLYDTICDANEWGLSPEVYNIFRKAIEPYDDGSGLTKEQISANYLEEFHRPMSQRRLNKYIIPSLLAAGLIYKDESTGKGGNPLKYRLSSNMEKKQQGEKIDGGQSTLTRKKTPINDKEKLDYLLKEIFLPNLPVSMRDIEEQVDGVIKQKEIPKLLKILNDGGKIFQPDGYKYQRV